MRHAVLFPDTNIFLQCRALKELPWAECINADRIDLLIGAPIQDEIDRLKQDGNQRRARRARDTNRLFREILDSAEESITLRESHPQVILRFAPALPVKRTFPETLDLTRADERLIEEVLYYRLQDDSAHILTGDTGIRLRARRHDVPVLVVPDSWMLPPENDERDKEIGALKTQVARLQSAEPVLDLLIRDANGQAIQSIFATMPFYPALSAQEFDQLISEVQLRYPTTTDFGIDGPSPADPATALHAAIAMYDQWHAPTQAQIDDYRKAYDEWMAKVRRRFERLDLVLNVRTRVVRLQLELRNTGSCSADEALFKVTAHAGLKFCIADDDEIPKAIRQIEKLKSDIVLAMPPQAPKGESAVTAFARTMREGALGHRLISPEHFMPRIPPLRPGLRVDRHVFYRQDDDVEPVTRCSFSRPEFRHRSDAQIFRLWISVPPTISPAQSHLYCRISARNLTKPFCIRVPITLEYQSCSTLDIAKRWHVESR